ncbi:hypothetical protein BDQ17DRAFT_1421834 [Cyathus striatus]|nr:hypothetical protein BDQ17DRAFT_1421834 [Cyathus striatus]
MSTSDEQQTYSCSLVINSPYCRLHRRRPVLLLAFILLATAIKGGIEDYSHSTLDEEVDTSTAAKPSGGWRNVNKPTDPRCWIERALGINPPNKVICGVCKLHEHQPGEATVVLEHPGVDMMPINESSLELEMGRGGAGERKLDDVQSVDEHERSLQRESLSSGRVIVILGR